MKRVLYIEASPRKIRSSSIEIAREFLNAYQLENPKDEIISIDLWNKTLPRFDQDVIDSKYAIMHGKTPTESQKKAWKSVEEIISEFKNADKYLFSVPMWNFGIPYILKQYLDIIVQPGYTFSVSDEGEFKGMISEKPVLLCYARGGSYGTGSGIEALDLQTTYMNTILKFIGFQDIRSILIEPTLTTKEKKQEALLKAKAQAMLYAKVF
jgi:FMN-dependent NADH-azoreductase